MSTGTGVWRQTVARAAHLRARSVGVATPEIATPESANTAITALARHVFFVPVPRTRILFLTSDDETDIPDFCERIGKAVAEISNGTVSVVVRNSGPAPVAESVWAKEPSSSATALGGNLWRVPVDVCETHFMNGSVAEETLHFDYWIFGASISDGAAPLLCQASDGVVLVIRANHTHREVALRAGETLLGWNVKLLGAVLDNRTFPVPESIYRRL